MSMMMTMIKSWSLLCAVLQLCYNQLTGSIPTQWALKKLNALAQQSNQLTGAIPASLGEMGVLMRLDLSFNRLFGSIPTKLADAPLLEVLNIRNNTLSGNVPLGNLSFIQSMRYFRHWF
ncbi:Leucine-rich repeat protein kinase family protein [Forsythia ovata]|uniref:Leucine-rich repeat protein kinase family protein n=1 Tax=Forsythia ovata TaxID=205694 RepID=A0ABD1X384_9LAMI